MRGGKFDKARITIGNCCNATGTDLLKLCVIGTAKRPRAFGRTWQPTSYVHYYFNKSAWMTGEV